MFETRNRTSVFATELSERVHQSNERVPSHFDFAHIELKARSSSVDGRNSRMRVFTNRIRAVCVLTVINYGVFMVRNYIRNINYIVIM